MWLTAKSLLILAGLILPGQGWARAGKWEAPWLGGTLLSWLFHYLLVVGLDTAGISTPPLLRAALLLLFFVLGFALALYVGWRPKPPPLPLTRLRKAQALYLLLLPLLCVAIWKALKQPLWSADVVFRWDHLARMINEQGNLAHYPPVNTADFTHYFWADGIAPLASSLQAWSYGVGGDSPSWSAIPILLQWVVLLFLIRRLARSWGGQEAGVYAVLAASSCFILQFAVNLGQETGLSAIGTSAMLLYLSLWQRESHPRKELYAAAFCAALAACSREYMLLIPALATLWLIFTTRRLREATLFALIALTPAGFWHLRNYLLTGNPFYSMELAGLFPVNPVFGHWMQYMRECYRVELSDTQQATALLRYFWIGMAPALAGLLAAPFLSASPKGNKVSLLCAAGLAACWWISVPLTSGGLFYSMRVLSPLIAVGAAFTGVWLARARWRLAPPMIGLVLGLWILDASARALVVPDSPYRIPLRQWLTSGAEHSTALRLNTAFIEQALKQTQGATLSLAAGAGPAFKNQGRKLSPLWTPELAFLIDPACGPGQATARLQALGYDAILINQSTQVLDFLRKEGILERLGPRLHLIAENEHYRFYELPPPLKAPVQ